MLTVEVQAEILTKFFTDKRSIRSIAMEFGINRESVRRVIERRTIAMSRNTGVKESILEPYKQEITELLERDAFVTMTGVMNRIRAMGYTGGRTILGNYLKSIRKSPIRSREAFLRIDFAPGDCAQVDWAEFGDVFGNGIKIHCFVMVLCYSRMLYIEFTRSEKFEDFIRCHENAFKYFGGIPRECWYDNLTSAVTDRLGNLIKFNARFMAYMGHHGIRPHACNVARGNEKGRVENAVNYIRQNFWSGRKFSDFEDLIKQSIVWRNQIANRREHRSTKKIVTLMFEKDEKPVLLTMNPHQYETDEIFSKVVPPDFHVIYETNRYSVPWTLTGMTLTLRVNATQVKFYYNDKYICSHSRSYLKNKVYTQELHQQGLLDRKPGSTRDSWQLHAVKQIGPRMKEYIELLKAGPRSLRYEMGRILALSVVYGEGIVYAGCLQLLSHGVIGVDALEVTLKKAHHPKDTKMNPEPLTFKNEKLNRVVPVNDLRQYDALLFGDEMNGATEEVKNDNIGHGQGEPAEGL